MNMNSSFKSYSEKLEAALNNYDWSHVEAFARSLQYAWGKNKQVFICGNGGSAANAMHIANDLLYGVAKNGAGLRAIALPSNTSLLTCLGNDLGYDQIFSKQIQVFGGSGDILIALSGRGNSRNVINALEQAKSMNIHTFAIIGYDGGKCLDIVDHAIHFPVYDMQISEDLQLIVSHMIMQSLCAQ